VDRDSDIARMQTELDEKDTALSVVRKKLEAERKEKKRLETAVCDCDEKYICQNITF